MEVYNVKDKLFRVIWHRKGQVVSQSHIIVSKYFENLRNNLKDLIRTELMRFMIGETVFFFFILFYFISNHKSS